MFERQSFVFPTHVFPGMAIRGLHRECSGRPFRPSRAHLDWVELGCALDLLSGACPFRNTGFHFPGHALFSKGLHLDDREALRLREIGEFLR